MDECVRLAQICAKSGLLPKSFYDDGKDPVAAAFVAIQLGAEVGLSPMTAVQYVAVVNGRPTLYGPAQLAIVQRSGLLEIFEEGVEFEAGKLAEAWCRVKRTGRPEKTTHFTWSQASKAGLTNKKGPWQEYPERMMQARARTFALRDHFPDVLLGLAYSTEEMGDVPVATRIVDHVPDPVPDLEPEVVPPKPEPPPMPATFAVQVPYGGEPVLYARNRGGAKEALAEIGKMFNDKYCDVVLLNSGILDQIATKFPDLAEEIRELRTSATDALTPHDEPPDGFAAEFVNHVDDDDDMPADAHAGT
jgi:hypothetical protein